MEPITITLIITIFLSLAIGIWLGIKLGKLILEKQFEKKVIEHRKDAILKSRAVLTGQFSEQLAPYLPNFKYNAGECKFIGKPVDFIVFKGLDDKENKKIKEIVFVEVKSGNSKLTDFEKQVKEAIEQGRVSFEEYRIFEKGN
jgi:predicted Holliday junction resolvase-like endonuclease